MRTRCEPSLNKYPGFLEGRFARGQELRFEFRSEGLEFRSKGATSSAPRGGRRKAGAESGASWGAGAQGAEAPPGEGRCRRLPGSAKTPHRGATT